MEAGACGITPPQDTWALAASGDLSPPCPIVTDDRLRVLSIEFAGRLLGWLLEKPFIIQDAQVLPHCVGSESIRLAASLASCLGELRAERIVYGDRWQCSSLFPL